MIDAGPQKSALSDPYDIGWVLLDDAGYTEDEAYAFLTADVSEVFSRQAVLTASANPAAHTGAMIALVPSRADLERLALKRGEPLEELHLTLAYLGEAAAIDEDTRSRIIDAAGGYFTEAINTEAFSVNVFNPHNPATETAVVLGIKGEQMADNHSSLMSAVRGVFGGMPDNHKPWIPHVTLKYTDDVTKEDQEEFLSRLGPVKFDTLRFAFADQNIDIPLYDEDDPEPLISSIRAQRAQKDEDEDEDEEAPGSDVGGGEALSAAFWRAEAHPRDPEGKFAEKVGSPFAKRMKKAEQGKDAVKSFNIKDPATQWPGWRQSIRAYQSSSYDRKINSHLRSGASGRVPIDNEDYPESMALKDLDEIFAESKTTKDVQVFRGIKDPSSIFGDSWKADGDNTGLGWLDRGFTSTTADESVSKSLFSDGNTVMRILIPKGTSAAFFSHHESLAEDEKEIVINRGSRFRIRQDYGVGSDGIRHLDVEVLPQEGE